MITYPIVQKKEQETDDYIPNSVKEGTRNRWLKEGQETDDYTPNNAKEGTRNRWLHTQ